MVYGDDVTHIVTEEGIANLLLCRDADEREQAIRGVAGYTAIGRGRDRKAVERLRERGVIRRPEDLGIDPLDADRNLLAARSIKDLVHWSGGAVSAAVEIPQLVGTQAGMEHLTFRPPGRSPRRGATPWAITGVVASGNLEVLVERVLPGGECVVEIATTARGFGEVWQAVVADFVERRPAGGLRISINDGGARPDTVALRLAQAARLIEEDPA